MLQINDKVYLVAYLELDGESTLVLHQGVIEELLLNNDGDGDTARVQHPTGNSYFFLDQIFLSPEEALSSHKKWAEERCAIALRACNGNPYARPLEPALQRFTKEVEWCQEMLELLQSNQITVDEICQIPYLMAD